MLGEFFSIYEQHDTTGASSPLFIYGNIDIVKVLIEAAVVTSNPVVVEKVAVEVLQEVEDRLEEVAAVEAVAVTAAVQKVEHQVP